LKPGFVALVRRAGVPVYPVGIAGAYDALPRKAKWLRPKPLRVVFGEPFGPEDFKGGSEGITAVAAERIASCVAEAEEWLREGRRGSERGRQREGETGQSIPSAIQSTAPPSHTLPFTPSRPTKD